MLLRPHYLLLDPDADEGAPAPGDDAPVEDAAPEASEAADSGATDAPASLEDAVLSQLGISDEEPAGDGKPAAEGPAGPESPGKAAAEADVTGSAKAPAKEGDAPADPDAELLTPPDGLSEKASERYQKLVDRLKEERGERETHQKNLEAIVGSIRETGASPQEFHAALGYMRAVHSDDPKDLEQAREVLATELRAIDTRLGRPPQGETETEALIARHEDLRAAVEHMDITAEMAARVAAEREARQRRDDDQSQRRQAQERDEAFRTSVGVAAQQVSQLEATLRERDPNYARLEPAMNEAAREIARVYPPEQWTDRLGQEYRRLRAVIADPAAASGTRQAQPLRPGQGGSTQKSEPATMEDAVLQKLGLS